MIVSPNKIIATGFALWLMGFLLSLTRFYPYCYVGIALGFFLFFAGIVAWVLRYERTYNTWPQPIKAYKKILKKYTGHHRHQMAGREYIIHNVLEYWTFGVALVMVAMLVSSIAFRNSDAFELTKSYVESDNKILNKVGSVEHYGFMISGSFSSSNTKGESAQLRFSIIGSKGRATAESFIENEEVVNVIYQFD